MKRNRQPTNRDNVTARLFLRFFLCYLLTLPLAWPLAVKGTLHVDIETVGTVELLFIPLALLGSLLTVTKPYLLLLTVCKAVYDTAVLLRITSWARAGLLGFLPWNACLLTLILSLLLYTAVAARAERFAFFNTARDTRLLFSRSFARLATEGLVFTALALSLYYLWPQLLAKFGMLTLPL